MSNDYYNNNDPLLAGTLAKSLDINTDRDRLEVAFDLLPTLAEIGILSGATVTTAELNLLEGVTATTAELNILDGITATTAELNILDGVTASTAEINILDGVTVDTATLNLTSNLTSISGNVQTLLNAKADITGQVYSGMHDFSAGSTKLGSYVYAPTLNAGADDDRIATTSFVQAVSMAAAITKPRLYFFSQI